MIDWGFGDSYYGGSGSSQSPGSAGSGEEYVDADFPDDEDDEDECEPTHECRSCQTAYCLSSPTDDYRWCEDCERVQYMIRLTD